MPHDLGGNTRDILALGHDHPAEKHLPHGQRETRIRRFGRGALATGIALLVSLNIGALVVGVVTDAAANLSEAGRLFGSLALVAGSILGGGLVLIGGAERLHRNQRTMTRLLIREAEKARQQQEAVAKLVAPLPARIAALEAIVANLPDYGRGVIDGVQMRQSATGPENDRLP